MVEGVIGSGFEIRHLRSRSLLYQEKQAELVSLIGKVLAESFGFKVGVQGRRRHRELKGVCDVAGGVYDVHAKPCTQDQSHPVKVPGGSGEQENVCIYKPATRYLTRYTQVLSS